MTAPNTMKPAQLARLIGKPDAPALVDICIDEDFAQNPRLIPTSFHHPFKQIEELLPNLQERKTVVICQKDNKLSQWAMALLRIQGVDAAVLEDGIFGWRDFDGALLSSDRLPARGGLWVTRHRPKVDCIACPWLIRGFIDPDASFLFMAPSEVLEVAEKFNATPFDVEGAELSHNNNYSFDAMLAGFGLDHPALRAMAAVICAADGTPQARVPEAAGLLAISLGLSRMYRDDLEQLEAAIPLYDALYRWARDAQGETNDWAAHGGTA